MVILGYRFWCRAFKTEVVLVIGLVPLTVHIAQMAEVPAGR